MRVQQSFGTESKDFEWLDSMHASLEANLQQAEMKRKGEENESKNFCQDYSERFEAEDA